jgi:hypothetical protein
MLRGCGIIPRENELPYVSAPLYALSMISVICLSSDINNSWYMGGIISRGLSAEGEGPANKRSTSVWP